MISLSIAATGMIAQQLNVEVISNNIANMNTTGYKRQRAEFQDLLYQNLEVVGSTSSETGTIVPSGVQIGTGVKAAAVYDGGGCPRTVDGQVIGGNIEVAGGRGIFVSAGDGQGVRTKRG